MENSQNYLNHTRWYPLVHFVIMPLLLLNLLEHLVRIYLAATPSDRLEQAFWALLSVVLILMTLASRLQSLTAQDRVIRMEERIRYKELLSSDLAQRASNLPTGQIIALRFASDEELEGLVTQVLDGKLTTGKEINMAVKNWRGDYLRV